MLQGRAAEAEEAACAVPAATYMPLKELRTSTAAVATHHSAFFRLRSLLRAMANNPPNRLGSTTPRMVLRAPSGRRLLALTIPQITNIRPPGAGVKASRAERGRPDGGLSRAPLHLARGSLPAKDAIATSTSACPHDQATRRMDLVRTQRSRRRRGAGRCPARR